MKIKVYVVEFDLSPRQKKIVRAAVVSGAVIAALGIGVAIAAGPINTNWITDGGVVSAGSLQGNLNDLQTQISTMNGTVCGATAATQGSFTTPASLGGYAAGDWQCQQLPACPKPTAHMCRAPELINSSELDGGVPQVGWLATGVAVHGYDATGRETISNDCVGFTTNLHSSANYPGGFMGTYWNHNAAFTTFCDDSSSGILCCQ